ncbi:hypothetical protein AAVH_22187 [Aphelenchoides avenae]|nr:hypothetical protein AAVH_22187 [Aphelenchus avenae]
MANVNRVYRPGFMAIIEKADGDDARKSQTSPSDQTNGIGTKIATLFELASVCDAGCDGLHRQCSDEFLVKGRDGPSRHHLRNVGDASFVHIVLCLSGGRLLQDRSQEIVQFFEELLGYPPDRSSDVLSRWYSRITGGSAKKYELAQDQFVQPTATVGHDDADQPGPSRQAQCPSNQSFGD